MRCSALLALPAFAILAGCATLLGADFDRGPAPGDAGGTDGPGVVPQDDASDCAVVCTSPPPNTCLDARTARAYPAQGSCAGAVCTYTHYDVHCANGCEHGACTGVEPCNGVACVSPPGSTCIDATTLTSYSSSGVCSAGQCSYPSSTTNCTAMPSNANAVCESGACDFACKDNYTRVANTCVSNGDGGVFGWTSQWRGNAGTYLYGVWGSSRGDIYAVGEDGSTSVLLHSTGDGVWTAQTTPNAAALLALWGSSSGDVYAVGDGGLILHSSGDGTWAQQGAGVTSFTLNAIWGSSKTDVYAAGTDLSNKGQILHSSGDGTWTVQITTDGLQTMPGALWGSGPNDIYATADTGLYHSTGNGSWTFQPIDKGPLNGIWGTSSTNFYVAVGHGFGQTGGAILHFTGNAAFTTTTTTEAISDLWGSSARDVYAVGGSGKTLRSTDGDTWVDETNPSVQGGLTAIWGSGGGDIYAAIYYPGAIVHRP